MKHHHLLLALALTITAAAAPATAVPPAQSRATIEAGLKTRDRALHLTTGWIRDPYIVRGPDGYYYLTGTTPAENDPREQTDPYNTGLGPASIVGPHVRLWRSKDLIDWEYRGIIFSLSDSTNKVPPKNAQKTATGPQVLWAPELHWLGDRWALVHCPGHRASFALAPIGQKEPGGPWTQPLGSKLGEKHDPGLYKDADGTLWLLWTIGMKNAVIAPLDKTHADFAAPHTLLVPGGPTRTSKLTGETTDRMGHEGAGILKIPGSDKYIYFGTAWSTDKGRHGSYNLYYCTSDKITGPYGPRKFLGRFLGHGTPFQTPDGQWWCTAFYNANVPPLPRENIETRDLSTDAQTINRRGVTIVPLDIRVLPDGDIHMRALDPAYATPGPDESQQFPN